MTALSSPAAELTDISTADLLEELAARYDDLVIVAHSTDDDDGEDGGFLIHHSISTPAAALTDHGVAWSMLRIAMRSLVEQG